MGSGPEEARKAFRPASKRALATRASPGLAKELLAADKCDWLRPPRLFLAGGWALAAAWALRGLAGRLLALPPVSPGPSARQAAGFLVRETLLRRLRPLLALAFLGLLRHPCSAGVPSGQTAMPYGALGGRSAIRRSTRLP